MSKNAYVNGRYAGHQSMKQGYSVEEVVLDYMGKQNYKTPKLNKEFIRGVSDACNDYAARQNRLMNEGSAC